MNNTTESKEIEIQVQIENSTELLNFLESTGEFIGKSEQKDTYYVPAHRNFLSSRPIEEWLRLRDSSGKYSINYKNWHYDQDGRSHYCDEYETPINDLEQLEKIFEALNMKQVITVDKIRKIWKYKDYEISLDKIVGLGDFVEIEYKSNTTKNPTHITKEMINFLKKFNVGEISRNYVGYPFQLLFPKEVQFEKF